MVRRGKDDSATAPSFEIRGQNLVAVLKVFPHIADFMGEAYRDYFTAPAFDKWYPGKPFVDTIERLCEVLSSEVASLLGMKIYENLRDELAARGVGKAAEAIASLAQEYPHNIRGEGVGSWFVDELGDGFARLRNDTIMPCAFEQGVIRGALEAFGGFHVKIEHPRCREAGADYCVYNVTWLEGCLDAGGQAR